MPIINEGHASRVLPFPLKESQSLTSTGVTGAVTLLTTDIFPVDPDEPIALEIELSLNEYTTLASAIDIGRDIGFGDQSQEVWFLWCKILKGLIAMSCADVADCIETDEAVQTALNNQLLATGFAPSGNEASTTDITMSPSAAAENLLPASYTCSDGQMMATARRVISEFDQMTVDFFQSVELVTNPGELAVIASDGIPVADSLNNIIEFFDWIIQTLQEIYVGSYNQAVENELACDLFCLMRVDCELTYNMLIEFYNAKATIELPSADMNDFQSIVDWAIGLPLDVGVGTVASWHLLLVLAMKFASGVVFEMTGLVSLKSMISFSIGQNDTSYDDCDCVEPETPDTYWYIAWDFSLGQFITEANGTTTTKFQNGGWEIYAGSTNILSQVKASFGATTFYLAGGRMTSLRRGSNASGTNDFKRINVYPNEALGGTPVQAMNSNFLGDGNDVTGGSLSLADNAFPFKSMNIIEGVSGSFVQDVNFARLWKLELWGWNHSDVKPAGSVWVSAIV